MLFIQIGVTFVCIRRVLFTKKTFFLQNIFLSNLPAALVIDSFHLKQIL
jgi:hypothetical protein